MLNKKEFKHKKIFVFSISCLTFLLFFFCQTNFFQNKLLNVSQSDISTQNVKNANINPFNFFPFSNKTAKTQNKTSVILGGGVYSFDFKCSGVIVLEFEDVKTLSGFASPLKNSDLKRGSVIIKVNGEKVKGAYDFISKIESSDGAVKLNYIYKNKENETSAIPAISLSGVKKLGVWVKDDVSATGTLSFIDSSSNKFYALGHAITDFETGAFVPLDEAVVKKCKVIGTEKSRSGKVGEIKTVFSFEKLGSAKLNGENGVVGFFDEFQQGAKLPLAESNEVKIGKAKIFCTLDSAGANFYDCEIIKVQSANKNKNLTIRITDKNLLEKSGGIVQGMSGSPIVQNGKVIGVLTHGFVNNPKLGFATIANKIILT